MSQPLLAYEDVSVCYANGVQAVRGVGFALQPGECLALVGESGCGKTTMARAVLGLLPASAQLQGSIRFNGHEIVGAAPSALRALRGQMVGFVAQDPFAACNPLTTIFSHVAEAWRAHRKRPPVAAIVESLSRLGIPQAQDNMQRYPHQWSGGMLQRATISAAAAHRPPLIIADEPTSALDADRADSTLAALKSIGSALLLVSHDIGVVARHADRIAVCYAGQIVEINDAKTLLKYPRHPYTISLLDALPKQAGTLPTPLPGTPPRLVGPLTGCAFVPRCPHAESICHTVNPALHNGVACHCHEAIARKSGDGQAVKLPAMIAILDDTSQATVLPATSGKIPAPVSPVAEVMGATMHYGRGTHAVCAVQHADLQVMPGEIVGISGPSGCGKSTLLRLLATIEVPTAGEIRLGGLTVARQGQQVARVRGGFVMPIFQDPQGSLDRRWPIWRSLTEPLTAPNRPHLSAKQLRYIARERLHGVGLAHIDPEARPGELSVGQCQRIAIARALIAEPSLIIADEPTSALDASVSAAILHLLAAIAHRNTAIVMVSHDRPVLDALCTRVLTMRDGMLGSGESTIYSL